MLNNSVAFFNRVMSAAIWTARFDQFTRNVDVARPIPSGYLNAIATRIVPIYAIICHHCSPSLTMKRLSRCGRTNQDAQIQSAPVGGDGAYITQPFMFGLIHFSGAGVVLKISLGPIFDSTRMTLICYLFPFSSAPNRVKYYATWRLAKWPHEPFRRISRHQPDPTSHAPGR
jgi:hypothetical protein